MIGTIANTCTIIVGGVIGALLHRGIKDKYKNVLYDGLGLVSVGIGLNATISYLPKSNYPVLFVVAIAIGGVVGTRLDIDGWFHRLVERKGRKAGGEDGSGEPSADGLSQATDDAAMAANEAGKVAVGGVGKLASESGEAAGEALPSAKADSRANLADGLSTAILLYCIGPLSMLGPVISALQGDNTFLYTNATLDFVSSLVFASTYGIGMILAAPVLFCWQGAFYLVGWLSQQAISDGLMAELLILGGLMIMASGLNLLRLKDCKTLNLLPSLLVPILFYLAKALMD